MSRPLRIQFSGAFYHVLSRGIEKNSIFWEEDDYLYFLSLLKLSCKKLSVLVHSFCLMNNHFHLLLETKEANLSIFMKRLLGNYSSRFNSKYKRHGPLFQGRYKAILVDKENYLHELSRYIHLNPCKAGITHSPENYKWSSMQYFQNGVKLDFLETKLILSSFKDRKDYREFVIEGLNNKMNILEKAVGGVILGSEDFVSRIKRYTKINSNISRKIELEGSGLRCDPEN